MSVKYKLVRTPNPGKDENKVQPYHIRFAAKGTIKSKELIDEIKYYSSFSSADIEGMLDLFQQTLVMKLSAGYNVELKGLGTFSLSLKCPPETDKKNIGNHNIRFRNVKFRAAAELKDRLKTVSLQRVPEIPKRHFSLAERRKRMLNHIQTERYITGKEYQSLNNISKTAASLELKKFIEEGIIVRIGKGPATLYMLP